ADATDGDEEGDLRQAGPPAHQPGAGPGAGIPGPDRTADNDQIVVRRGVRGRLDRRDPAPPAGKTRPPEAKEAAAVSRAAYFFHLRREVRRQRLGDTACRSRQRIED